MPLYNIEVIYTVKYKKRVRAKDEQEAHDKASAMWIEREVHSIADEWTDYNIEPVAYQPMKRTAPPHTAACDAPDTAQGE